MSAIFSIVDNSGNSVSEKRLSDWLLALRYRGVVTSWEMFDQGAIAIVRPESSSNGSPPPAHLWKDDKTGLIVACHGSLYDTSQLYVRMGASPPRDCFTHPARSMMDAYLHWGEKAFNYWTGEASLVIWDPRQSRLLAVRDPMGVRPLFYFQRGSLLAVCTDTRALLQLDQCESEPDPVTMRRYLCQNNFFHDEHTFFRNIHRILPGYQLSFSGRELRTQRYWQIKTSDPIRYKTGEEYGEAFQEILNRSVTRRHLDTPGFGSGLSGGLDSSSIVCLIHRLREKQGNATPLPTMSILFQGTQYDETDLVKAVVGAVQARSAYTDPKEWDIVAELEKMAIVSDEPAISMSVVIFWIHKVLSQQNGLNFLLSGAGADELLAGELYYFADLLRQMELRELFQEIMNYARINSMGHSRGPTALFLRYALAPLLPLSVRRLRRNIFKEESFPWLGDSMSRLTREEVPLPAPGLSTHLHREMATTILARYTPLLMHYEDRNAAAHGIEGRFPFLDPEVVKFCFGLPRKELMNRGHAKIVLKQGMKDILPFSVWKRQAKSGIPALHTRWMTKNYRNQFENRIQNSRLVEDGWINGPALLDLYQRYAGGNHNLRVKVWRVLSLEGWYRQFWPGD